MSSPKNHQEVVRPSHHARRLPAAEAADRADPPKTATQNQNAFSSPGSSEGKSDESGGRPKGAVGALGGDPGPDHAAEKSGPQMTNWTLFLRLLRLSWVHRWGCLKVLFWQIVFVGASLAVLALTGLGIDVIRHAADPSSPPPQWPLGWQPPSSWSPWLTINYVALSVLALAFLRGVVNHLNIIAGARLIHTDVIASLRRQVYDRLQQLSFRFFDSHNSGSVINRVTVDVAALRQFIDGVLLQLTLVICSLAFYLAYMLSIDPLLTVACLATTPLLWTASALFTRIVRPAYDRNRELVDQMVLRLSEGVLGVQVVKGFAREQVEIDRFREASGEVRDQMKWIFWRVSIYTPVVSFLTQFNLFVLLVYGGWLVMNNQLALGTGLVVFAGLLQQFSAQVTNVAGIANSVQQSLSGARRVFEVLDRPVEIQSAPHAQPLPQTEGRVELQNVSFGYDADHPVLNDVSLRVEPGQCVAILGATGAGKSTLLSLLPRFYDPSEGCVLLDGHDVRDLQLEGLRRHIGIVFQESFLFSNTVRANIAFGHPEADDQQIQRAAQTAAAHHFIEELPDGYDTVLGEFGVDLSGGQRQRLAIARAILLEPKILLLDDPTAAIDPETEEEILESMERAMQGRTTFVVAHRLSTLRRADWVIVLEKGRIVQQGRHAELFSQAGHYRRAALLQAGLLSDAEDYEADALLKGRLTGSHLSG